MIVDVAGNMKFRTTVLALPLVMGACASSYEPPLPTLPSPQQLPEPPRMVVAVPDTLPEMPTEDPVRAAISASKTGLIKPRKDWFKGLTYAPPYHPNHGYVVYVAEGGMSKVELMKREIPQTTTCPDGGVILSQVWTSMGAGATESWILQTKAKMQAEGNRQIHCTVVTNRGAYNIVFQTVAVGSPAHVSTVRFSDPYNLLAPDNGVQSSPICQGTDGNYRITGNLGAFGLTSGSISNDGAHTCIRFPPSAAFDLPAAWLVEGDQERPASPSTINGAYLIDGVPPVIELRTDNATIRIERLEKK